MIVCKFGGSSLASADQIRKVCDIVLQDRRRHIVVASAPGKRHDSDIKVTDLLISYANAVLSGYEGAQERGAICSRFAGIAEELELERDWYSFVSDDLDRRIRLYGGDSQDLTHALKAAGEDCCARLLADYLQALGEDAEYVDPLEAGMLLRLENGQTLVEEESYERLAQLRRRHSIVVFPGFFGGDRSGRVRTFSRGGSDISGAILAAAIKAEVYENWTDVDGVYVVHPSLVRDPEGVREITYTEMRELAYAGFTVLHEEAISPTQLRGIPVNIRNTNNPSSPGTRIVSVRDNYDSIVTGIAGSKGFTLLHLSKHLMNREVGFAMRVLSILADLSIPFEHMPSGIDSLSIVIRSHNIPAEKEAIVVHRLRTELGVDQVSVNRQIGIVMIVGEAMAQTVGVTARAATALSRAGVNLELIIQGASEISVIFGVREAFVNYAVKELYKEFFS
ncbi:MAG: aspartate kinase [Bacillota bacterium]|nr:aspartate kinase [Bacillota bacterium]